MHWYFRDISDDPSEKELTQLDQFNNDEVSLAEALVRETIQNSTDARASTTPTIHVRFSSVRPEVDKHRELFWNIISGLVPHLRACDFSTPALDDAIRLLVIEDFGTTGLTGSVEEKDDEQFSGFWRRFGRSNKKEGHKGGRWGLGKLVFPSVSETRTVIGLTRRMNDTREWIMGQAVLRNHLMNGSEVDSVGFWCRSDARKKGVPSSDRDLCNDLRAAAQLMRREEPGLSLIVPYVLQEITSELLLAATIRNYYFPILTERLKVSVDDVEVNASTFDNVTSLLPEGTVSRSLLDFVRHIQNCREIKPLLELPADWQENGVSGDLLGSEVATMLRESYRGGGLIFLKAPVRIVDKNGKINHTTVSLFLKRIQPGERGQTLVVRGAITIPTEGRRNSFLDCNAALIAEAEPISRLLGDAENPSHTQWNERAEKLRIGWQGGWKIVRRIRALLPELHELITERVERDDPLALLDFFSIPRTEIRSGPRPQPPGRPQPLPPAKQKPFRIEKRKGGFAILPTDLVRAVPFPLLIRLTCAYDVLSGNPFKRFSEYDFDLFKAQRGTPPINGSLAIKQRNANCWPTEPNKADVRADGPDFSVEILGFDANRDLVIEAETEA